MIDKLLSYYFGFQERPVYNPAYIPEAAVVSGNIINPSSKNLAVIFPGWHGGSGFLYDKLAKRLTKRGWAVLDYKFHDSIIEADDATVIKSFKQIQKQVAKELQGFRSTNSYEKIHLIGISLGNVPLAMVCKEFPGFDSATLVVAGDDLAWDMWHGILTQDLRRGFEKEQIGIRRLDKDWLDLAPKNNLKNFALKPVKLYVALKDDVIRTPYQKRLAEAVAKISDRVSVKNIRSGHAGTIVWFCLLAPLP